MNPEELFLAELTTIDRALRFVCHRSGIEPQEAEEFGATVKLRLIENDYAIIRAFQNRSSFGTYIAMVIHRMLLDYRATLWGKWRPSAEAKRLGPLAVELERMMFRDNVAAEEAAAVLARRHREITPKDALALAARLPQRPPKKRTVSIDEVESTLAVGSDVTDGAALDGDYTRRTSAVSAAMRQALEDLDEHDRVALQLRFVNGMAVSEVARAMAVDQRMLYRRMDRLVSELRSSLEKAGVGKADVEDLFGHPLEGFDFGWRDRSAGPSKSVDSDGP